MNASDIFRVNKKMNPFKKLIRKLPIRILNALLIFLVVAVFLVLTFVSYNSVFKIVDNNFWENHTYQVIIANDTVISDLENIETGQRGYVLTGIDSFLAPYNTALENIDTDFQNLQVLTKDNPAQQERLSRMRPLIDQKLAESKNNIALRNDKGAAAAIADISLGKGKQIMDSIRSIVAEMNTDELSLLQVRTDNTTKTTNTAKNTLLWGGIIGLLFFFLVNYIIDKFIIEDLIKKPIFEREKQILESIGDGVIAIDRSFKITLFNNTAAILSGWSAEEVIGKPFKDAIKFIEKDTRKENIIFIEEAMLSGEKKEMGSNILLINKDGHEIPVADSAAPVKNAQGEIIGCVIVFRDISVEQEVVRMKDEFLSLASHELRTPMTAIAGFVDMILEGRYGQLTKELREPLGYVAESTDRLIRLVNDLLNVSRIEAGRMTFKLGSIDLNETVFKVVAGLQPIALGRKIKLTFDNTEAVQIQGDIEKVEQILNNLIGNALKFTDKGGISIALKKNDDLGVIEITDTGVGIPMEGRNRLFGKFEQINTDPAGRPPGTGLGLYLSRQMAQKMGGDIKLVTSTLDKGSTFGFSLPVAGSALSKRVLTEIKGSVLNKE